MYQNKSCPRVPIPFNIFHFIWSFRSYWINEPLTAKWKTRIIIYFPIKSSRLAAVVVGKRVEQGRTKIFLNETKHPVQKHNKEKNKGFWKTKTQFFENKKFVYLIFYRQIHELTLVHKYIIICDRFLDVVNFNGYMFCPVFGDQTSDFIVDGWMALKFFSQIATISICNRKFSHF